MDVADEVAFIGEDSSRADPEYRLQCFETAAESGATILTYADTVGYATPEVIHADIKDIVQNIAHDGIDIGIHCHNDLGLAVANSLTAVTAGAREVQCTVNGVGERAGNASLEEIVMATRGRNDLLPYATGIQTEAIYAASQLLTTLTNEPVQANKAIVGRNAFAHEAGIHQDGMLKDRRTYEIMRPEDVGVPKTTLVLGKHSGRHAVQSRCEELGQQLSRHELDRIYQAMIRLADEQKTVGDDDLQKVINQVKAEQVEVDA